MIVSGFRRYLSGMSFFIFFLAFTSDLHAQRRPEPALFSEDHLISSQELALSSQPFDPEITLSPEPDNQKSPFLAGVLSFVLPGLGEAYAGRFDVGKYSLGIEVGLVAGLIGTTVYANSLETDYQILARTHAGVSSSDKSDQYWKDISSYQSWEDYNQERLRQRDLQRLYGPENAWEWDSEANRKHYRDIRISSDEAFRATYYFIAAMGLNRLFSIINAVRFVNNHNESQDQTSFRIHPRLHMNTTFIPDGMGIFVEKSF